jgi:hypothetical protein
MAALESLELMGGGTSVPPVQRLAGSHKVPEVSAAARKTLGTLQARRSRELQSGTLLRPTVSPTGPDSELLRPTFPSGELDPGALLRPSESAPPQENTARLSE